MYLPTLASNILRKKSSRPSWREIRDIIKRRKLTQTRAATLLGLKQPDVSALSTGRVHKFSLERLLRCARRLDQDVAIVVRPKRSRRPVPPRRPRVAA